MAIPTWPKGKGPAKGPGSKSIFNLCLSGTCVFGGIVYQLLRSLTAGKENIRVTALAHSLGSRRHLLGSLTVGKENTAKSGPVVRLRFLHNEVILNYFCVQFIEKLS